MSRTAPAARGGVELFTPDLDVLEECVHANATVTRVDRTGE